MKLDDLRSILLSERETGRLTAIAPDIFAKGHAELAAITKQVYASEDPFSDDARALIDETLAIRETLQDLFSIRSRKILALTVMHAEGDYYDREEVKRMIPAEKDLFDQITTAFGQCQAALLYNVPRPVTVTHMEEPGEGEGEPAVFEEVATVPMPGMQQPEPAAAFDHPCVLVHVLENMDSFMGVDGRIYTLAKGDIVTLPERNAAVLSERNIVLNINLCK
jgi:DNA replication factor GINS